MSSIYLAINGWREILARVFDGFPAQPNVSPEWLVNPATHRRLKLDIYYPNAGFAVRFVGLTAKGQRRQSDWEALEEQQRDENRVELCRLQGVQLMLIDPLEEPVKQLDILTRLLTRSSRMLAQGERADVDIARWMPALSEARGRAGELRSRIQKNPDQMMANLAEAWRDRELGADAQPEPLPAPKAGTLRTKSLAVGQRVHHERFGSGVITALTGEGAEAMISILFDAAQERTFLVSLVQDKLRVLA
jgi:hypothetical protein